MRILVSYAFAIVLGVNPTCPLYKPPFQPTSTQLFCIIPEIPEAYKRANAVFVGKVVRIIDPLTKDLDAPLTGRFHTVEFKVEKSWKGATVNGQFSVLSAQGAKEELAFPVVHIGEEYLVFADPVYDQGRDRKDQSLITSCGRTKLVATAERDLKQLNTMQKGLRIGTQSFDEPECA